LIREVIKVLTRPLRRRWQESHAKAEESYSNVEEFLKRAKRDLKKKKKKKKKEMPGYLTSVGTLPETYAPVPENEDRWVDVGLRQERLSTIMDYYVLNYRWNPLSPNEDINFNCRDPEVARQFQKDYEQIEAIKFYRGAHA